MKLNLSKIMAASWALIVLLAISVLAQQKPCQTASKFGPDDQIGNVNYITPAKTLAASKLVTKGRTYRLGVETNKDTPAYGTRTFNIIVLQPAQAGGATIGPNKVTYNDYIINGWVGIGSQIDGLGHLGIDGLYFNCNKAADFAAPDGLKKLGVEKVPAIATRGVLLDMAGYFNTDIVKEGTAFNRAEIEGAMKREGTDHSDSESNKCGQNLNLVFRKLIQIAWLKRRSLNSRLVTNSQCS